MVEVYSALMLLWSFLEKVSFLLLNTSTFPTCPGSLATCEDKCVQESFYWRVVTKVFHEIWSPLSLPHPNTERLEERRRWWGRFNTDLWNIWFHPLPTLSCLSPGLLDDEGEQLAGKIWSKRKGHQFWKSISLSGSWYSVSPWRT